jgi:GNAT superfamily N-acetyltransferase
LRVIFPQHSRFIPDSVRSLELRAENWELRAAFRPILSPMPTTRSVTQADAALITTHRRAMFAAISASGPNPQEAILDQMSRSFEPWVKARIAEGKYLGWIVEENGRVAGSAGLLIVDWPPHPFHPESSRRAYLLNVFVEPEFRKRGLAHSLIEKCLAEAHQRGIRVVTLHSSDAGRPVYEKLGFHPTSEMMYVGREES